MTSLQECERQHLIDDIEHALYYGERVGLSLKNGDLVFGVITDATNQSFTVEDKTGTKRRVKMTDVVMFDNLDAET